METRVVRRLSFSSIALLDVFRCIFRRIVQPTLLKKASDRKQRVAEQDEPKGKESAVLRAHDRIRRSGVRSRREGCLYPGKRGVDGKCETGDAQQRVNENHKRVPSPA